ncbi:MAG: hypothetical protein LC650_00465 [Actinobacteria bacterium]|nr:hypothetical protein [Actinomycetota bacterium]
MTPNYIDIEEFVNEGFLQEVNRQFFHPRGLALEAGVDEYGWYLRGVWDYRDDPEGILFFEGVLDTEKADRAQAELDRHVDERLRKFGYVIQPKE